MGRHLDTDNGADCHDRRNQLTPLAMRDGQAELTCVTSVLLFNRSHSCTDLSIEHRTLEPTALSSLDNHSTIK